MTGLEGRPLVVAMTGASGSPYGIRFVEHAVRHGLAVDLVLSDAARRVIHAEQGEAFDLERLVGDHGDRVTLHSVRDVGARIASGSFMTHGMVVVPCSTGTLGRVAAGVSASLIERAADVHLKERRPLVLVLRETPLSTIHIENMLRLSRAGATILPASPGFYGRPETISELVDFVVARAFQALGIVLDSAVRWTGETE